MGGNYRWLGSLPRCFQAPGPLSKELKIKDHTDVQKQQDSFIRSKAILQVLQGDTVVTDKRATQVRTLKSPDCWPRLPLWGSREGGADYNRYTWVVLCLD